jgi:RHO1 GDP-GTP exchange protein 1/2
MYVQPLITANPPIIPPQRLKSFITDVFHNYAQLLSYHRRLLERLHQIQQEEHPLLNSITAALLDAFLNWRDAYLEYVPNYPIAAYRIAEERANNPQFKAFHDVRSLSALPLSLKFF